MAEVHTTALIMAAPVSITTEPAVKRVPLWAELETTELRPIFASEPAVKRVPLWAELEATELRPTFETEPVVKRVPLWAELEATELRPTFETEPTRSQPFIDSLDPVLVGSDWRLATLLAAKLDDTVALPVLAPEPGTSIKAGDTIFIPCGDRIPEFGDVRVENNYTLPSGVPGLLDARTIIIIDDIVAYMSGAAQSGFTVTSTPNLINGFNYLISGGPGGQLPIGPAIEVSVYLEGVESFQDSYDLEIQDQLTLSIDQVFVVAKDIIKVIFDSALAATSHLSDPTTYTITGGTSLIVARVLPIEEKTTTYVFLQLSPKAEVGVEYTINIAEGAVFSPTGDAFLAVTATWTQHRTKTDGVVASLAGMYDTSPDSTLRFVLQAISIIDEEIGGDS